RDKVNLGPPTTRECGIGKEIHTRIPKPSEHLRPFPRFIRGFDVEIIDPSNCICHHPPSFRDGIKFAPWYNILSAPGLSWEQLRRATRCSPDIRGFDVEIIDPSNCICHHPPSFRDGIKFAPWYNILSAPGLSGEPSSWGWLVSDR